jgi:hypothetical protein
MLSDRLDIQVPPIQTAPALTIDPKINTAAPGLTHFQESVRCIVTVKSVGDCVPARFLSRHIAERERPKCTVNGLRALRDT